jgi:hypothetical protein
MKRISKILVAALSFGLVAVALGFLTKSSAQAPSPVTVDNTTTNPVPTSAVGTTTVSGRVSAAQLGAWRVGALQSGSWSVGITNTSIPVSGSVGVSDLPANLSTTPTTPVYVDTDRPARNGFNSQCSTGNTVDSSGQSGCTLLMIPAGRQVVIETVSCQAEVSTGNPGTVLLNVPNTPFGGGPPTNTSYPLALSRAFGTSTSEVWRISTPFRVYGTAPTAGSDGIGISFQGSAQATVSQGAFCAISGYEVGQ